MKLAILKERRAGEARVAATSDTVKKLKALGLEVSVEAGAGAGARISDTEFAAAGAEIAPDVGAALRDADIVLKVRIPDASEISLMKRGAILIGLLAPHLWSKSPRPSIMCCWISRSRWWRRSARCWPIGSIRFPVRGRCEGRLPRKIRLL